MHAGGHGAMAFVAGACARALTSEVGGGDPGRLGSTTFGFDALSLGLLGLAAVACKGAGGVLAAFAQARLAAEVGASLRLDVLEGWLALHRLRRPRHGDQRAGGEALEHVRAVAGMTTRVRDVEAGLQTGVLGGARALAQLVPLLVLLVLLSPTLAACAALVFVPFSIVLGRARARWKREHKKAMAEGDAMLQASDEAVRHADLWTTYGAEKKARETVARLGASLARHGARVEATAAGISAANEVLGAAALVLAIVAARSGLLGQASGGLLLSFSVAFFLAYKPLRDLTDARLAIARARLALEELGPVLAHAEARPPEPEATAKSFELGTLELDGVALPRGRLGSISLRVPPGDIVAIVGPTGSGKTTLLRTLLGLEAPAAGEIRYDGAPIGDAPPGPAHRPFAWVPQDAPLLADSLAANVALADSAAATKVQDVLAPLGAAHLADALKDATLGLGGREISGGERRWIALARAVATRSPILLLDEPTSGLDPASQEKVLRAIERLRGQRTVLMVTHRPEPLAIADRVVRVA